VSVLMICLRKTDGYGLCKNILKVVVVFHLFDKESYLCQITYDLIA